MKHLAAALSFVIASAASPMAWAHGTESHEARGPNLDPVTTPFGQTGDPKRVSRTIQVDMADTMRFVPDALTVRQGETVRFVVRNAGKVLHEMVIGSEADLKAHAEMMRKHPTMEHDAPYMAHVAAGKRGEMVWQFTQVGEFKFACLIPGHFEAGMVGTIQVVAR
jgi:uncharacterized cupredoxin-like copper-binding protein